MERNVYAPPAAAVADPVEVRAERPLEVVWALRLLWTSLAVGIVTSLGAFLLQLSVGWLLYFVVTNLARYIISIWIILKIGGGRNWARILYLVVLAAALGYAAIVLRVEHLLSLVNKQPLSVAAPAIKSLLDIGAACLLWMPSANRWFKPPLNEQQADPVAHPPGR